MSKPMTFWIEEIRDTTNRIPHQPRLKSCSITLNSMDEWNEDALLRAMTDGSLVEVRIVAPPDGAASNPAQASER